MVNTSPVTIDKIIQLLHIIVDGFGQLMDYVGYTIGELVDRVLKVNAVTKPIANAINFVFDRLSWNGEPINAIQLGEYILGGFLLFYIGYVFLIWLFNLVT